MDTNDLSQKKKENPPKVKTVIDTDPLVKICEQYRDFISSTPRRGYRHRPYSELKQDKDFQYNIFEAAIKIVFGSSFWDWKADRYREQK